MSSYNYKHNHKILNRSNKKTFLQSLKTRMVLLYIMSSGKLRGGTTMWKRIVRVSKFIRGDYVVLDLKEGNVVIDAGNKHSEELQTVARKFFNVTYNLSGLKKA